MFNTPVKEKKTWKIYHNRYQTKWMVNYKDTRINISGLKYLYHICGFIFYSGIIAAILGIIALSLANSAKDSKIIAIVALVTSVVSIGLGYWRAKQLAGLLIPHGVYLSSGWAI